MKVRKTEGPDSTGELRGHCHDGCGWTYCDFWRFEPGKVSKCMMFGGADKHGSLALNICDKIYGVNYEGDA